jgi:hypothetical protein
VLINDIVGQMERVTLLRDRLSVDTLHCWRCRNEEHEDVFDISILTLLMSNEIYASS